MMPPQGLEAVQAALAMGGQPTGQLGKLPSPMAMASPTVWE